MYGHVCARLCLWKSLRTCMAKDVAFLFTSPLLRGFPAMATMMYLIFNVLSGTGDRDWLELACHVVRAE